MVVIFGVETREGSVIIGSGLFVRPQGTWLPANRPPRFQRNPMADERYLLTWLPVFVRAVDRAPWACFSPGASSKSNPLGVDLRGYSNRKTISNRMRLSFSFSDLIPSSLGRPGHRGPHGTGPDVSEAGTERCSCSASLSPDQISRDVDNGSNGQWFSVTPHCEPR